MDFSRFNYFVFQNDSIFIFNTKTGLMCEISSDVYNNFKNNKKLNPADKKMIQELKEKFFIVDTNNEIKKLEKEYQKNCRDCQHTSITFAPTLKCNFDCNYCYERKSTKIISSKNVKILLNFLENYVLKKTKQITFSWFGGEPTLCKDLMISFSKELLQLCQKYKVDIKIMVITNGYFLNDELINFYKSINNFEICITIDGFKEEHNKRRYLTNGTGTFEKIIDNLKILLNNNINTTIRVNIDKKNYKDVANLVDYFETEKIKPNKIYLGHIQNFTNDCKGSFYLTKKEFAQKQASINKLLFRKKMLKTPYTYEGPKKTFCKANFENSIIIDYKLNLYKCENDIGRDELAYGNILEKKFQKNNRFKEWSPFNYKKCRDCFLLPSCMGGCAFTGMQFGEPQCPSFKYNFENEVKKMIIDFKKF